MAFPRLLLARASAAAFALLVIAGSLAASAATPAKPAPAPSPSASPNTATNCVVDPAMQSDPQLAALTARCKADLDAINGNKSKLQDSIALAEGSAVGLQQMLQQTRDAIVTSRKKQDETRARIHDLEVQQLETSRQIDATRIRLARRRAEYANFLRRNYKFAPQLWSSLFESSGISDFLAKATTMVQVQAFGHELLLSVKAEAHRLDDQQAQLNKDHTDSVKQQDDLVKAEIQLADDAARETTILIQLQNSIADASNELNSAGSQSAALVAQIVAAQIAREDQLIAAANDAAWQAAQAWMASNSAAFPPQGDHSRKFPFVWPAQKGAISQGFGPTDFAPEPPAFGAAHFHAGVDVANSSGTPIVAADDGVVAAAEASMLNGNMIGYGRHVILAHKNGMLTLYGHLDAYGVKVGQAVHQGDLIGVMGSTGNSSGPHLHFELRINNTPVDPMPY
ncbi:MAG: peptidoglycan DD-metalloendopeptidase family protein, partial [Candidatus Dormibacteraeota bacterium]|nr:peptidoglycan DD-metalloendopeptidase family protein [Candidatus Dormibacteraeota bacterium]